MCINNVLNVGTLDFTCFCLLLIHFFSTCFSSVKPKLIMESSIGNILIEEILIMASSTGNNLIEEIFVFHADSYKGKV